MCGGYFVTTFSRALDSGRRGIASLMSVSELDNESVLAIEATLQGVDHALERLRAGTYRTCATCAAPLDEATLAADPLVSQCGAHLTGA